MDASGETFFFRDRGQFDLMRLRLLPELIEQHHSGNLIRFYGSKAGALPEADAHRGTSKIR